MTQGQSPIDPETTNDTLALQHLLKLTDTLTLQHLMKSVKTVSDSFERLAGHNGFTVTPAALLKVGTRQWKDEYSAIAGLTPRQLEVLALIAEGYNNRTIAEKLVLGAKSVENYINAVYQELSLSSSFPENEEFHPRVKAVLHYRDFARYAHAVMTALRKTADADSPPSPSVDPDT